MALEGEQLLPRPRIPYLHLCANVGLLGFIPGATRGRQTCAVRAEHNAADGRGSPVQGQGHRGGEDVPDLHGAVLKCAGQVFSVRAKSYAVDSAGLPLEGEKFLTGLRVPDLDGFTFAAGQTCAVWAEYHTPVTSLESQQLPARLSIPHLRPVGTSADQALAVWAIGHTAGF